MFTALALTNPGAETGTAAGWTLRVGSAGPGIVNLTDGSGNTPHAGNYYFSGGTGTTKWDQEVDVSAFSAEIDAGMAGIKGSAYHSSLASQDDKGGLYLEAYDAGHVLIDSVYETQDSPNPWVLRETLIAPLPVGTRFVRIGTANTLVDGAGTNSYWDDFVLEISDDQATDFPRAANLFQARARALLSGADTGLRAAQLRLRTLVSFPAAESRATQVRARVTSAGSFGMSRLLQGVIRVLLKFGADDRRARAWHFPQDGHDFYVLNLGNGKTLVFDCLTRQWTVFKSPFTVGWRAVDGFAWEHENIGGDMSVGLLWNINAEARDDDDTSGGAESRTPIRTVVRGMLPLRLRNALGCYRATLTVAQGSPVAEGVGITLRTSVDEGLSWTNHGELVMDEVGRRYDVSWAGLGLITEPGMIFEFVDTGYTRRINALDIDLGDEEGKVD